jgi:hypothetical protein
MRSTLLGSSGLLRAAGLGQAGIGRVHPLLRSPLGVLVVSSTVSFFICSARPWLR